MIHHKNMLPDTPPPTGQSGIIHWMKINLFSSWLNTLVTLLLVYVIFLMITPLINWSIIEANWHGDDRYACSNSGACWVFIKVRFEQFMYGFYPQEQLWRVNSVAGIFLVTIILLLIKSVPFKKYIVLFFLFVFPVITFLLLYGGLFDLEVVETHQWGGLMLTLVLAVIGIVLSLPFGILLALGRRSRMPVIRGICTVYIEIWRGVPLITVLFMASVMLPLFFPENITFDKLLRAMIGITLFQSAYMAEVVRGGLQAIPAGQYEAASSLGFSYWQSMRLIILPQTLRLVIPGIVNTFIALFKDTSLVLIIGLFDLLGIAQTALADPQWLGYSVEAYVFAAAVYWVFCFSISRYGQYLEDKLNASRQT